ncbi:MAG: hypothetical protein COX49_04430 [bacterium (Candidatus Stahlbacteria) CG23_combo_of_CG06-09_8_20_14_all_40_9]|nr:MAG: hypothetical protein COX49_04430 [bacterium (Candidatus Stahlbacteria) CG23_combo_of_CG06-09_8_20_14_all_40_9]
MIYLLLLWSLSFSGFSQAEFDSNLIEIRESVEEAVNGGDKERLVDNRNCLERLLSMEIKKWLVHHYLAYVDYRLVNLEKDKESRGKHIKDGILHLEKSIEINNNFAEAFALLSLLYNQEIGINPALGMTNSIKSGKAINKAYNLDPENPRIWLIDGIGTLYKPTVFGGGENKALKKFLKSAEYYKTYKTEDKTLPNWGKAEVYTWLGITYMKKEENQKAMENFNLSLEIEPDYKWAKQCIKELEDKQSHEK